MASHEEGSLKPLIGVHSSAKGCDCLGDLETRADRVDLIAGVAPRNKLAAIVIKIDERDVQTFYDLREVLSAYADTPIIAVTTSLSTNLGVELIKLGIADCMCIPSPPQMLWRKLERAILHSGGPTIDSPVLALLWDADAYPRHEEKRRCFRSETVADYPAYLTVVGPVMLTKMLIKNLSILTEGCPGGLALIGTNVHLHALTRCTVFRGVLEVPQFPKPIPAQCSLKRVLNTPTANDPASIIGVEYKLDDPSHEAQMRRFWSESQRRVAAAARESAGRIA